MAEEKIYIAGPMSGIINHNTHEFNAAEKMFIARGYPPENIFNPAQHEASLMVQQGLVKTDTEAYRMCMRIDLNWILDNADALYMLQGWERSYGAKAEHALAVCLGLNIYYQ